MSPLRAVISGSSLCPYSLTDSHLFQGVWLVLHARRHYHVSLSRGKPSNPSHIVSDSLPETLRLHRDLNRKRLIRKIYDPDPKSPAFVRLDLAPDAFAPATLDCVKEPDRKSRVRRVPSLARTPRTRKGPDEQWDIAFGDRPGFYPHPFKPRSTIKAYPQSTRVPLNWSGDEECPVQQPWFTPLQTGTDGLSRLADEIGAFERYMAPTTNDEAAVRMIRVDAEAALGMVGSCPPILVGSRRTGLALRHSDVDLLLPINDPDRLDSSRGPSPMRPKMMKKHLTHLWYVDCLLQKSSLFTSVLPVRARVPVVSAIHCLTGLEVQFMCGEGPSSSLEHILDYQSEFPTLRALLVVLRMALETRNLFGSKNGSIGSYGLVVMIVAALKLGEGKYDRHDTGRQLLHILELYKDADFDMLGVAVDSPGFFEKWIDGTQEAAYLRGQQSIGKHSLRNQPAGTLCIQDPADFVNDLGRTCRFTKEVQGVFRMMYDDLQMKIKEWDGDGPEAADEVHAENGITKGNGLGNFPTISNRGRDRRYGICLLHKALAANYRDLERARDKIMSVTAFKHGARVGKRR